MPPRAAVTPSDGWTRRACEPVCPVKAISAEAEVPEKWKTYTEMNADFYQLSREEFKSKWGREP